MTLTGAVVVDHHHHEAHDVFPIIGAHVIGMYALVIVVGDLIDRIGRTPGARRRAAPDGGVRDQPAVGRERARDGRRAVRARPRLEPLVRRGDRRARRPHAAVGARQAARLQRPARRALTGAGLALLGGVALTALGVAALAIGGRCSWSCPALWILRDGRAASYTAARSRPS